MIDYSGLIILLVYLALGMVFRCVGLLKDEHIQSLPAILLNIAYPAMIIDSIISVDVGNLAGESLTVVAVTAVISLSLYAAGRILFHRSENYRRNPLMVMSLGIGNIVYLVLPVIKVLYGDQGVYYAMLHSSTQDVLIWTFYYQYFAGHGGKERFSFRHFATPCFGALVIALIMAVLGVRVPSAAGNFIESLSAMTIPLALIYLGGVLVGFGSSRSWMPDGMTVVLSLFKVLVLPFLVFGVLSLLPVTLDMRIMLALFFAAPTTIMSTVWARQFDCDYRFAIRLLFLSTFIFFIALIPFFALLKHQGMAL